MIDIEAIAQELKTTRDEIKLKIHLGSKELQEEWDELEKKYDDCHHDQCNRHFSFIFSSN